jgi:hypothetical protein
VEVDLARLDPEVEDVHAAVAGMFVKMRRWGTAMPQVRGVDRVDDRADPVDVADVAAARIVVARARDRCWRLFQSIPSTTRFRAPPSGSGPC